MLSQPAQQAPAPTAEQRPSGDGRGPRAEAAAALGVSERTFRRWRGRHAEDGSTGLVDRRVGKPSPRRAPEAELQRMLKLYHEHYAGFAIRHFHRANHGQADSAAYMHQPRFGFL